MKKNQNDELFDKLWNDYSIMNAQAPVILSALEKRGERVQNDHIAFRTFNLPEVGIEAIAQPFLRLGYQDASGKGYEFPAKKLFARHFEHPSGNLPKIFISELKVEACSDELQSLIRQWVRQVPGKAAGTAEFLISGRLWECMSFKIYQEILKESEYAAWMGAFGFRVNHFTVFFNTLSTFKDFCALNEFIKTLGFPLNAAGGEIKGSPKVYLEQSSTLAFPVRVDFADGPQIIPGCYYEFARRYPMPNGKLFQGFLPDSADKIFESTHYRPQ